MFNCIPVKNPKYRLLPILEGIQKKVHSAAERNIMGISYSLYDQWFNERTSQGIAGMDGWSSGKIDFCIVFEKNAR
jgi:hypothetical protein